MKFTCNYSCKHYFGERSIEAKTKEDALIGLKLNIESNHRNTSKETLEDCGKKCKLKIKIK